jgi:hypothetical protein
MTELEIKVRAVLHELRERAKTAKDMALEPEPSSDVVLFRAIALTYSNAVTELEKALTDGP